MKSEISATRVACMVLTLAFGSISLAAQTLAAPPSDSQSVPAPVASEPANPVLKLSPEKALLAFEPPLNEEYTLSLIHI